MFQQLTIDYSEKAIDIKKEVLVFGCGDSRRGVVLGLPLVLCLGSTRGAKDTEMIFLVSQLFGPVRVILVSCRHKKKKVQVSSCFFGFIFIQSNTFLHSFNPVTSTFNK